MRVAIVTREFEPETCWGGIGTHYVALARGLAARGVTVHVFTQALRQPRVERSGKHLVVHRVVPRMWVVGPRRGGPLAGGTLRSIGPFALSLARELAAAVAREHDRRPLDLVEGHEHLGVTALLDRRAPGLPRIVRYQTAYDSLVRRGLADWPRSALVRRLERRALARASWRIATSGFIDEVTRTDFPGIPEADAILPNIPVIEGPFPREAEGGREALMLFVGRLMPGHKNPVMAAEAFRRLAHRHPSWRIEFAGLDIPLRSGGTAWERCRAVLADLEGRFHYHGLLHPAELRALYRRARILLVPSSFESFGLVAVEAMACGCVPVVADRTSLPEVVGDGGVVFENGSIPDLTDRLDRLIRDPAGWESRSRTVARRAHRELAARTLVERNLEAYERWLAGPASAPGSG